jgi:hypothetical protein
VETLPLFIVTVTRNVKSQEIFKLNSLNHITIKVESYIAQTGLTQCCNCQNFGHVWANCKQPFVVWWWLPGYGMPRKDEYRIYAELLQLHPSRWRETSSSDISRMQPCERRSAQRAPKGPLGRTFFPKFTSPEQSYAAALRQDNQHQEPKAPQTEGKSVRHTVQHYLSQKGFQKTSLSV